MSKIHFAKGSTEAWHAERYLNENLDTAIDFWSCSSSMAKNGLYEVRYGISFQYIDFNGQIAEEITSVNLYSNNQGLHEELTNEDDRVVEMAAVEFLLFNMAYIISKLKTIIREVGDGSF